MYLLLMTFLSIEFSRQTYGSAKRTLRASTIHTYKTGACSSVISTSLFGTIWTEENVSEFLFERRVYAF